MSVSGQKADLYAKPMYDQIVVLNQVVAGLQKEISNLRKEVITLTDLLTQEVSSSEVLAHRDQAIQATLQAAQYRTKKTMWLDHSPTPIVDPTDPAPDYGQQTC